MRKNILVAIITGIISIGVVMPVFAGQWQQNERGWWYDNGNGTYPANVWQWIDGNGDGISECYYFDSNGYCLMDSVTPDGNLVNKSGAWVQNGIVQTRPVGQTEEQDPIIGVYSGYYVAEQGKTGVDIVIFEDMGELWAETHFYNLEGYSNVKEGSCLQRVNKKAAGYYELKGDSWISRPSGYSFIDWSVKLDGNNLYGNQIGIEENVIRCKR